MFKDEGNAIIELINALIAKNEITFALKLLEEFRFDKIKSDKINYLKAVCYLKLENKDYTKALNLIESLRPENKTNESEYLKHFCHFKIGNYESIVKYHLANEEKFNKFNENFKLIIAIAYEKLHLLQNAKNIYKEIIKSHPNNKEAINNLSILDIKNENTQDSISYLKKCFKRFPNNMAIANNYALCLIQNKFCEEGLQIFEKTMGEINFKNNKDHRLKDRIKINYINNLIKYGKNESIELYVKNQILSKGDLNGVNLIVEKLIANNKTEAASQLIKKLENEINEGRIDNEELKRVLNVIPIKNTLTKNLNNSLHSKNVSQTEIFKAVEFTIENIDNCNSKMEKNKVCEDKAINKEDNIINLSFSLKNSDNLDVKENVNKSEKDVDGFGVNSNEENNSNPEKIHSIKKDQIIAQSFLNNKKVINDNFIFERFQNRKKLKISPKEISEDDKQLIKSQEEMYKDILLNYNNKDCIKCRDIIEMYRANYAEADINDFEIACISARIHYDQKEYSKVIDELKKYYQQLDEANLSMLVYSSKIIKVDLDYLNFLEEDYRKYHSREDTLLELIVTSVKLFPSCDLKRTEKYVDEFFVLKGSENKPINCSDFENIINILLSSSNFADFAYIIIEKMKNSLGITPLYYFYLGRYNIKKHNINQAYENFLKIEPYLGNRPVYKKYLGKIYIKLGNYGKAIQNFKQALKIDANDWTLALSISSCFINLKDFIKAEKYLNYACKINSQNESNIKINFIKGLFNYNMKNYESALNYFQNCFKIQPRSFKVIHYIALTYINTLEISEAESLLKQILQQKENFFPSKFELFRIKLLQNNIDDVDFEFIADIESNIQNYPVYSMDYSELLLKFYGNYDKAMKYYEMAVKNGKKSVITQAIKFSEILNTKKEFTKAIKCYKILLNNCDKDYIIFKGLKDIFFSMKLYDEAIKTINTFLKNNPNSIEANADLGDLYYLKQNYYKALDFFTKAVNFYKINSDNKLDYIKKKIALCRINLKLHETAYKFLEEYSKIKNEENIYLLMAFLKILYFDCVEEANDLLKVI